MVLKKRDLFFMSFLLWSCLSVFSQNKITDSLRAIIDSERKDTATVSALNALSVETLYDEDIPGSVRYSSRAKELAEEINDLKGKAYALKNMGMAEYYRGDYLLVFEYWSQSLETFEAINYTLGIANMVNNLGAVYYNQGNNTRAIEYYLRSLKYSEELNEPIRIATALLNIGGVYGDNPNTYDNALSYYDRIRPYLKSLDDPQITTAYLMGIGEIQFKKGNYHTALEYYEQALPISKTEEVTMYANNLTELGKAEFELGNRDQAIEYLNQAYQVAEENEQQLQVVQSLISLGKVYQKSNISKALETYKKAESLAKEMNTDFELRDIYQGLSQTYASINDNGRAYKYLKLYISQKDSLFNIETDDRIRGLQFEYDLSKKEDEIDLLEKEAEIQSLLERRQRNVIFGTGIALFLIIILSVGLYRRYKFIDETKHIIEREKIRSDNLLLNILPEETARELMEKGKVKAKMIEAVTVMFTDFVGFTAIAKNQKPEELVATVDFYFSKFDEIMEKHNVEKIKTIGDSYMSACGLNESNEKHVLNVLEAAFEIMDFLNETKASRSSGHQAYDIRIGINTGPIVAGVVGTKKFAYDIWGDTVNVASRMETKSKPGKINVSESTYELIKEYYECEYRGEIGVKNKGKMKMFFVNSKKSQGLNINETENLNTSKEKMNNRI